MKKIILISLILMGCAKSEVDVEAAPATRTLTVACDLGDGRDVAFSTTINAADVSVRRTYEYSDDLTFFISIPNVEANPPLVNIIVEKGKKHEKVYPVCVSELSQ